MSEITKEMIEAAKAAYWHEAHNGGGYSDKCYEAAISAALSSRSAEAGKPVVEFDLRVTGTNVDSEYRIALRFKGEQFFESFNLGRYDKMDREQIALLHRIRDMYPGVSAALAAPVADIEPVSVPDAAWVFEAIRAAYERGAMWHQENGTLELVEKASYDFADKMTAAAPHPTKTEAVDADAGIERLTKALDRLRDQLDAIAVYGSDTLSGRIDGPADKDWYRDGVREMRNRARAALKSGRSQP
jgi:hypothetical protein